MAFQVNFQGTDYTLEDVPVCSLDTLAQANKIVSQRAYGFFDNLPPGHMWRRKLEHIVASGDVFHPVMFDFQGTLTVESLELLKFVYRVHDLGRVLEAMRKLGHTDFTDQFGEFSNHAEASVRVLEAWGVLDLFQAPAQVVIRYAIINHFGPRTPVIMPAVDETVKQMQFLITVLLRDLDKLETFRSTTALYLLDSVKKRQEIAMHGVPEHLTVVPADFLDAFERRSPLPFHKVKGADERRSYEGYMLYFLSWIFDVNLQVVMKEIIACGAINMLLQYFMRQLPREEYDRIEQVVHAYIKQYQLSLTG